MDPLQTETARFWENHGELQRRRYREDPDRGDPAADDLLRRGRGLADQLRPLAAMALGRRHAAGRGQARHLDHGADLSAPEGALPEGRRQRSRSRSSICDWPYKDPGDPTPDELAKEINGYALEDVTDPNDPTKVVAGRRASRSSASPSCATTARRPAAAGSTPAASTRRATTWPAATPPIPTTPASSEMGVLVAGQPAHPLQPCLRRPERQAVGSEPQAASSGTARSGRATTCPTSRRPPSRTWSARSS